jgi:hypothetical protein
MGLLLPLQEGFTGGCHASSLSGLPTQAGVAFLGCPTGRLSERMIVSTLGAWPEARSRRQIQPVERTLLAFAGFGGVRDGDIVKLDWKISLVSAAVTVMVAKDAFAQSPRRREEPAPSANVPQTAEPQPRWRPLSGFGMTLAGGGGVTDFTRGSTRDVTQIGGSWDVRLAFETRRLLGFEISYIGGANAIHGLGSDNNNATLIRNGIEGAARLNAPVYVKDTILEPYVAAGVGWNGYRITNVTTATASVSPTNENTLSVPLAVGFAVGYKGFIADARYTIRPTYKQTTLIGGGSSALTNWDVGGMLGYEF